MEENGSNVSKKNSFLVFLFYSFCFAGFLQYWLWQRAHVFSAVSFGTMMSISVVSLLYGALLLPLFPLPREIVWQRPIQLLFGFLIFNTLLFIVVISNFLSVKNAFLLFAGIVLLTAALTFWKKKATLSALKMREELPGMACLLLSGIGATLLCCDPLSIPLHENGMIYFPIWGDSFIHARFISIFSQVDGVHPISAVYVSGMPLPFYHYASYLMAAAVVSFTKVNAFVIFSCFLIPVGVFLLGLASFTLAHAFWKGWPAVAATVAVTFLPDAYYQGFQIKFLSYHFHLHIGPASFYGLGCAALAWLFVLQGCRFKKVSLIFSGWFFLGAMLCYKAQFFVANAFLLLLFPCFFFLRCEKWKKFFVACCTTLFFAFVVHISQRSPSVPLIALNGGGIHKYCKVLSQWTDVGALHTFLLEHLWLHPLSFPWFHLLAGPMIYFCTFGCSGVGVVIVLFFLYQKVDTITWSFPLWIIVNYLVMAMGLSMDPRHLADPEELLNRPLMWAYFAVAVWTASGLYFSLWRNQLPKTILGRLLTGLMLVGSLVMPHFFAHGLQTMPVWNITLRSNAIPEGMAEALDFIKQQSAVHDLVQSSEIDPLCIVSALTERQNYVMTTNPSPGITQRVKEIEALNQMTTEEELKSFVKTHPIAWYLLKPETKVAWPDSFKNSSVFQSGGYRVYHWQP